MSSESSSPSVVERILAYLSLTIIAVALLSFFATLIVGMNDREAMAQGLWPFVYGVSLIGLPIGFVLLMVLLGLSHRRRRRDANQGETGKRSSRRGTGR